jgi:hypothetical protein
MHQQNLIDERLFEWSDLSWKPRIVMLLREVCDCSASLGTAVHIAGTTPPHELGRLPYLL